MEFFRELGRMATFRNKSQVSRFDIVTTLLNIEEGRLDHGHVDIAHGDRKEGLDFELVIVSFDQLSETLPEDLSPSGV